MFEVTGIILFVSALCYSGYQLHKERIALNTDRRNVWKRAEELLKLQEEESTKRMELSQGFDWKANLPLIMNFLQGSGKVAPNDIQKLAQNLDMEDIEKIIGGGKK